jgi:hypothetical protein
VGNPGLALAIVYWQQDFAGLACRCGRVTSVVCPHKPTDELSPSSDTERREGPYRRSRELEELTERQAKEFVENLRRNSLLGVLTN